MAVKHTRNACGVESMTMSDETTHDRECFEQLEARLLEIPTEKLEEPRANPERAAAAALLVADACARPEIRARFEELAAKGLFELAILDRLRDVARAARHARRMLLEASATANAVQVPLALFQEATGQRSRMLKVLDYNCGDDPAAAARLAAIRGGKGHLDLANDLLVLADLYRRHATALAGDRRHYRGEDEELARGLASRVFNALSDAGSPGVGRWAELQSRAWTNLARTYDEVRRAGQFLFYYQDPEARFPSLFAAARGAIASPPGQ
jgi:hypothetical protein